MEVGRRKEGPMLILFRVRQHNEKTRQSAAVLPVLLTFVISIFGN